MADKFTFYASYYEAIAEFDNETRLKIYDMICKYALYGEIIDSENAIEKSLFTIIRPLIEASERRRSGGAPIGNQNARKQPKTTKNNLPKQSIETTENNQKQPIDSKKTNNINKNKNINKNININIKEEIKEEKEVETEEGTKRKRFIPPSLEEVTAYCKERNNSVNPESFIDFYESKGWCIGKNKMKDWKAAVRTWEKRSDNIASNQQVTQQVTDDELEKYKILANWF